MKRFFNIKSVIWLLVIVSITAFFTQCTFHEFKWKIGAIMIANETETHLEEGYHGITTSEGKIEGLYPLRKTGASTEQVMQAAQRLLQTLNSEQVKKVVLDIENDAWRSWSNVDHGLVKREGIGFIEMSDEQKQAAHGLLKATLSNKGYQQSLNIMKTDHTLWEQAKHDYLGEDLYYFTIFGEPSMNQPWGWQLEGHHLIYNFFILGDQLTFTPAFLGGEPVFTTSGRHKGNVVLQEEQDIGLEFMRSLSPELQAKARIGEENIARNNLVEANSDNKVIDYAGLPSSELNETQKQALIEVIDQYVSNIRDAHAKVKMDEIKAHIDDTWFAWIGGIEDDSVFYFRVHSPVIMIEFDHQTIVTLEDKTGLPTRNHIHSTIRTPNGNDYGKDYLRQHLEKHHSN